MELIINGAELFSSGTAKQFEELGKAVHIKREAEKIFSLAGAIRTAHVNGSPNNSRVSTQNATASAEAIVSGMYNVETEERFFGENLREAVEEFKKFFRK